jgi:DNA recombination protein RmuC
MEIALVVLGVVNVLLLVALFWRGARPAPGADDVTKALTGVATDLSARIEATAGQTRQDVSDRLAGGLRQVEQALQQAQTQFQAVSAVGESVHELNALLRLPHLRGGFGEASLEQLLSDFLPAALFEMQCAPYPGSSERADAIIKLAKCRLPIDSKFPREQVLPLFDTPAGPALDRARVELARVMKVETKRVAKYIRPEEGTAEMALMFLPSETLYLEVVRDTALWGQMAQQKVFPVSPNTLAVALEAVRMSHGYYEMARNVEVTMDQLRKARKHFENFRERFDEVGREIDRAHEAHGKASTNLERYTSSVFRLCGQTPDELSDDSSEV